MLVGVVASSRQTIRGVSPVPALRITRALTPAFASSQRGAVQVTYDIHASGTVFTNIPEECIIRNPWPPNHARAGTRRR